MSGFVNDANAHAILSIDTNVASLLMCYAYELFLMKELSKPVH